MTDEKTADASAKLVPLVYKDLASPSAKVIGATLAGVVRVALSPASFIVWSFDQAKAFAEERVTELLEQRGTSSSDVRPPDPQIAGPVIDGLRLPAQGESI